MRKEYESPLFEAEVYLPEDIILNSSPVTHDNNFLNFEQLGDFSYDSEWEVWGE